MQGATPGALTFGFFTPAGFLGAAFLAALGLASALGAHCLTLTPSTEVMSWQVKSLGQSAFWLHARPQKLPASPWLTHEAASRPTAWQACEVMHGLHNLPCLDTQMVTTSVPCPDTAHL